MIKLSIVQSLCERVAGKKSLTNICPACLIHDCKEALPNKANSLRGFKSIKDQGTSFSKLNQQDFG